ncbi:MAG: ATP-binding protein, partial [Cyclobacteriaceae bacterium]
DHTDQLIEEAVLEAYHTYLDNYLAGQVEPMAAVLHGDFRLVGNRRDEILDKEAFVALVSTRDEPLIGKVELRNLDLKLNWYGDKVMLLTLADTFVSGEKGWTYKDSFQSSVMLQQENGKWLLTHQHGTFPEQTTSEGEPHAIEQLSKENSELREMVAQQAAELELKNRELQVEAALERVRTRSMAMQNSSELQGVVNAVFANLKGLGIMLDAVTLIIIHEEARLLELWIAASGFDYARKIDVPYFEHPVNEPYFQGRASNQELITGSFNKKEKDRYFEHLFEHTNLKYIGDKRKAYIMNGSGYDISIAFGKNTSIQLNSYFGEKNSQEDLDILKRFARVFDQMYTRFQDLQKAERQARDAEIEAALERVRGNAMSISNSSELNQVTHSIFRELRGLGIDPIRFGIGLINGKKHEAEIWTTTIREGKATDIKGNIPLSSTHPMLAKMFTAWEEQAPSFVYQLGGQELRDYFRHLSETNYDIRQDPNQPKLKLTDPQYLIYVPYREGGIFTFTKTEPQQEQVALLERFVEVFQLTYTRYQDLQKAEEQAHSVARQSSLDRVRAEIASMRSTEDLQSITPLVWQELSNLNIPFFRCGVFIVDQEKRTLETYLSNPDGKPLATIHLPFDSSHLARVAVKHWSQQKMYTTIWDRDQFNKWLNSLVKRGYIESETSYRGNDEPPPAMGLHFIPFEQGMLYIGSSNLLQQKQLDEIQELAWAFEVAYARYDDFRQLEQAKAKVEATLKDLTLAQEQLIQQEKLASLGQLTAGIAHEIKNPLNFVNNFADLSMELIDEAIEEFAHVPETEHTEGVKDLLHDVKFNLQKIHHHGSRADGIVRSMLQHSRSSGGKTEPVELNSLIKEYVNLSFHGMRAGKKPINVKIALQLDEKIGELPLLAEEFSRVILNLCNNAFDAMHSKKLSQENDYLPELTVSTSLNESHIEIGIRDNGPGIPASIRDKILQPFFTTKKGTEGTGLGLSITHDIIKSHKGTLTITSEEGDYSCFSIRLPLPKAEKL